jgi:hypothetical protein
MKKGGKSMNRWILALITGPFVMVAFDAILHGLSHSGHGPLESIWWQAKGERKSRPAFLSAIGWHIAADILLGLTIFLLIAAVGRVGLKWGTAIGVLVGSIVALYWIHVYSAFETSGKTVVALGLLKDLLWEENAGISFIYGSEPVNTG